MSPMSTQPKKDGINRRVIMDLSWPHNGRSVNNGIDKNQYLQQQIQLIYPTVDKLYKVAAQGGPGMMGYKVDMDRAFKQIFMDMIDWPLLGITWRDRIYFDKTAVMGSRSAPYLCQHVTNFIHHIMLNIEYFVANYVDDFMGLDSRHRIWASFNTLRNLLRDLGASEACEKAVLPTHVLEFLGVLFDLLNMTISVSPQRLRELKAELGRWRRKNRYTRKQLESLLGKLQFVSNCVRPGRLMVSQLRNALRKTGNRGAVVNEDMRKDIQWWENFLPVYHMASIMWMEQVVDSDILMATDTCLSGMGGQMYKQYFHIQLLVGYREQYGFNIVHLELMVIVVGLKKWGPQFSGIRL